MTQTPLLEVKGVVKRFGGLTAVSNFNVTILPQELVGLIGPNGAGKTTVFNLITGVYVPTEGTIHVNGTPTAGLSPDRITALGIARTFQNIRLFEEMTVLENVKTAYNVRSQYSWFDSIFRTRKFREAEARVQHKSMSLLRTMGLDHVAEERSASLAYGQQRRLEIARALATKPNLLILDEPAAGMNPQETEELMAMIRDIRSRFNLTLLIIEHDMKFIMRLCERIIVLDRGKIIAKGTPQEVKSNPAVIAAYLGDSAVDIDLGAKQGEAPAAPSDARSTIPAIPAAKASATATAPAPEPEPERHSVPAPPAPGRPPRGDADLKETSPNIPSAIAATVAADAAARQALNQAADALPTPSGPPTRPHTPTARGLGASAPPAAPDANLAEAQNASAAPLSPEDAFKDTVPVPSDLAKAAVAEAQAQREADAFTDGGDTLRDAVPQEDFSTTVPVPTDVADRAAAMAHEEQLASEASAPQAATMLLSALPEEHALPTRGIEVNAPASAVTEVTEPDPTPSQAAPAPSLDPEPSSLDDPLQTPSTSARPAVQEALEAKQTPDVVPERGWTMALPAIGSEDALTAPQPAAAQASPEATPQGGDVPSSGWSSIGLPSIESGVGLKALDKTPAAGAPAAPEAPSPTPEAPTTQTPDLQVEDNPRKVTAPQPNIPRTSARTQLMAAITYREVPPTDEEPPSETPTPDASARPAVQEALEAQNTPDVISESGWSSIALPSIPEEPDSPQANAPEAAPGGDVPSSGWSSIGIPSIESGVGLNAMKEPQQPAEDELPESGWSSIALPSLEDPDDNR